MFYLWLVLLNFLLVQRECLSLLILRFIESHLAVEGMVVPLTERRLSIGNETYFVHVQIQLIFKFIDLQRDWRNWEIAFTVFTIIFVVLFLKRFRRHLGVCLRSLLESLSHILNLSIA